MQKLILSLALLLSVGSLPGLAAHDHNHLEKPAAPVAPDAAWLAQAQAAYPLKTCVVSDEEFGGDMGEAIDYTYKQEGKPDRLVRFCCKKCIKDFNKDPAQYLKKIDEAAAKAKKS